MVLFLVQTCFSMGVYDDSGMYNFYTFNPTPDVNVSINSTGQLIVVNNSYLNVNGAQRVEYLGINLGFGEGVLLDYNLGTDFGIDSISSQDDVFFKVNVFDLENNPVRTKGDPTQFYIRYDDEVPYIVSPEEDSIIGLNTQTTLFNFQFNEKIPKYNIFLNNEIIYSYTNPSLFKRDFLDSFSYEFNSLDLQEGLNSVGIGFEDFAGNRNYEEFDVYYRGEDLTVSLLTKESDSNLKYYYNKNYPGLFDGTIYSSEDNFILKVETSKRAKCFFSDSLISHDVIDNVINKVEMDSSEGLVHSIDVDVADTGSIWVGCENIVYSDDRAYLNSAMGIEGKLIKVKKYLGSALEITSALPEVKVTSVPFSITSQTNAKAICHYGFDGGTKVLMNTTDYKSHERINVSKDDGNYNLNFECFDVIFNKAKKTNPLTVSSDEAPDILSYSPKYTSSSSVMVNMVLTEDSLCKYSMKKESLSDFGNLTETVGTGLTRKMSLSNLVAGENKIYVYCQKLNNVNENNIKIYFDPNGPSISNITFINDGRRSEYVRSHDELSFEFELNSIIPVNKIHVKITGNNNFSLDDEISSNSANYNGNFSDAKKIRLIAENEIGKNSSPLEKNIIFDLNAPVLNFIDGGDKLKITCFDAESGCMSVYYGFSQTLVDCQATVKYSLNSSIEKKDNNFICARALDKVGREAKSQKTLIAMFNNSDVGGINLTDQDDDLDFNETETDSGLDDEDEYDDPFNQENYTPPRDGGSGLMVFAAIAALLVAMGGGGGYYAYSKGYLDDQLLRFGIIRKKKKGDKNEKGSSIDQSQFKSGFNNNLSKDDLNSSNLNKSRYDDHLKKLNKFLDSTIDNDGVFKNFDSVDKGKVEGYEDTLIKRKKSNNDLSKEDFDEFYSSSTSDSKLDSVKTMEEEAEDFENYYKDKKSKSSIGDENSKKNIKKKK